MTRYFINRVKIRGHYLSTNVIPSCSILLDLSLPNRMSLQIYSTLTGFPLLPMVFAALTVGVVHSSGLMIISLLCELIEQI